MVVRCQDRKVSMFACRKWLAVHLGLLVSWMLRLPGASGVVSTSHVRMKVGTEPVLTCQNAGDTMIETISYVKQVHSQSRFRALQCRTQTNLTFSQPAKRYPKPITPI